MGPKDNANSKKLIKKVFFNCWSNEVQYFLFLLYLFRIEFYFIFLALIKSQHLNIISFYRIYLLKLLSLRYTIYQQFIKHHSFLFYIIQKLLLFSILFLPFNALKFFYYAFQHLMPFKLYFIHQIIHFNVFQKFYFLILILTSKNKLYFRNTTIL